jgi:hypothetical protein
MGDLVMFDYAHPPGYDEASSQARAELDDAWRVCSEAHAAYDAAVTAAGGHHGRVVLRRSATYTEAFAADSRAREALSDPVRRGVDALLSIGAHGLDESHQDEVWEIATEAMAALSGRQLGVRELARLRARTPGRYSASAAGATEG